MYILFTQVHKHMWTQFDGTKKYEQLYKTNEEWPGWEMKRKYKERKTEIENKKKEK